VAQGNLERVRAGQEAFSRTGELDPGFFSSDFELHQASSIVDTAGVFRGRSALRDALDELEGAFEDLSFEAERYVEAPGGEVVVMVRVRGRGRGSGIQIDNRIAHVWTFSDGLATQLKVYEEPHAALEAVGIPQRP
jgi:ketosteroid isomerase-like protein